MNFKTVTLDSDYSIEIANEPDSSAEVYIDMMHLGIVVGTVTFNMRQIEEIVEHLLYLYPETDHAEWYKKVILGNE